MPYVKQFKAKEKNTGNDVLLDIYAASADLATYAIEAETAHGVNGIYVNTSNNFEINAAAAGGEKLNLVAGDAIQVKPGDGEPLQLDCEQNTVDLNEYGIKVCNGAMPKNSRVVGLKVNAAELTMDTQKANTSEFDIDEFNIKFRNDKWNGGELVGSTGPIYLKMKARAIDMRCHDHGGIALQIAGTDSNGKENKIKFESDRTTEIDATPAYNKEGGKGLEFGTFNNEHASLFCGDYRFKGDATVYGVTRNTPVLDAKGKTDYPTQSDDFKDVINALTPRATWNEILDAADKCKNLDETIKAEVAKAALSGEIDTSVFVTKSEVEQVVASAISEVHIDTTGLATEQWVLDKHYVDALPGELKFIKTSNKKGNLKIDVTGEYTWEQTVPKYATTVDEYNNICECGDRVVLHTNESFYEDVNKVYYKAGVATTLADGITQAPKGTIVYRSGYTISFAGVPVSGDDAYAYYLMGDGEESYYENPANSYYKCKVKTGGKYFDGTDAENKATVPFEGLSQEEIDYYDSLGGVYNEETGKWDNQVWEKVDIWKKCTLWTVNEININLETDSKIKFAGAKIETVKTINDVDYKMDEISLSTTDLIVDTTNVLFEQKISKNGDRSGQDTEFIYTYTNNVSDTAKTPDMATFVSNYMSKHSGSTQAEAEAKYTEFVAEGASYEVRVKISDLLGLVQRVAELENREFVAYLTLGSGNTISCDKTLPELVEAKKNGKDVYVIAPGYSDPSTQIRLSLERYQDDATFGEFQGYDMHLTPSDTNFPKSIKGRFWVVQAQHYNDGTENWMLGCRQIDPNSLITPTY